MRIAILGAGPAGLYLSYRLKRRRPEIEVRVIEQNSPAATFGFGVVFSDRALEFLCEDDPDTYSAIVPHLESWTDITVSHRGEMIRIEGVGFAAIGRLHLLQILRERARSVGIDPVYGRAVASLDELGEPDLIVGADGANSFVRNTFATEFGTTVGHLNNRFAWFGTTRRFETLTQTFRVGPLGHFNAHHYRYSPAMSTFIVETDPTTFANAGFDRLGEQRSKAICEEVFAEELGGCALVTNRSIWRQFPKIRNEHWWHRNCVLVGDALRTAHFSIGSGTRLAMEDVTALDRALQSHHDDVASALPAFEAARRPIVEKLVTAANASAEWYEHFAEHMRLAPIDFVMSYLTRSGRVDRERLRAISPRFLAQYEAAQSRTTAIAGVRA
jgi:2-polyprenyl-6-methoxyphenol hydroxylase-like FAD-dependent oxidoreductase